jgi:hypothetical protein
LLTVQCFGQDVEHVASSALVLTQIEASVVVHRVHAHHALSLPSCMEVVE